MGSKLLHRLESKKWLKQRWQQLTKWFRSKKVGSNKENTFAIMPNPRMANAGIYTWINNKSASNVAPQTNPCAWPMTEWHANATCHRLSSLTKLPMVASSKTKEVWAPGHGSALLLRLLWPSLSLASSPQLCASDEIEFIEKANDWSMDCR